MKTTHSGRKNLGRGNEKREASSKDRRNKKEEEKPTNENRKKNITTVGNRQGKDHQVVNTKTKSPQLCCPSPHSTRDVK